MKASRREIVELWQRAQEALRVTHPLIAAGFPDFAAARAYYAAFYAASALLLAEGKTFRSHRGVVALIHRDYVRPGRLPVDMGSHTDDGREGFEPSAVATHCCRDGHHACCVSLTPPLQCLKPPCAFRLTPGQV
jgi:uncharacterized protein (UPF0332 family)